MVNLHDTRKREIQCGMCKKTIVTKQRMQKFCKPCAQLRQDYRNKTGKPVPKNYTAPTA